MNKKIIHSGYIYEAVKAKKTKKDTQLVKPSDSTEVPVSQTGVPDKPAPVDPSQPFKAAWVGSGKHFKPTEGISLNGAGRVTASTEYILNLVNNPREMSNFIVASNGWLEGLSRKLAWSYRDSNKDTWKAWLTTGLWQAAQEYSEKPEKERNPDYNVSLLYNGARLKALAQYNSEEMTRRMGDVTAIVAREKPDWENWAIHTIVKQYGRLANDNKKTYKKNRYNLILAKLTSKFRADLTLNKADIKSALADNKVKPHFTAYLKDIAHSFAVYLERQVPSTTLVDLESQINGMLNSAVSVEEKELKAMDSKSRSKYSPKRLRRNDEDTSSLDDANPTTGVNVIDTIADPDSDDPLDSGMAASNRVKLTKALSEYEMYLLQGALTADKTGMGKTKTEVAEELGLTKAEFNGALKKLFTTHKKLFLDLVPSDTLNAIFGENLPSYLRVLAKSNKGNTPPATNVAKDIEILSESIITEHIRRCFFS